MRHAALTPVLDAPNLFDCWQCCLTGRCCRARKAWALQNDIAALDAANEAATGEYDKLASRNQEVLGPC